MVNCKMEKKKKKLVLLGRKTTKKVPLH